MDTNNLKIEVAKSPDEAPNYNELKERHVPASLEKAVIVRKGTMEGRSTVDLIFRGEQGEKHVAMITGRLLTSLAKVIDEEL